MFAFAIFICIYSYVIFLTGVYGVLTKENVIIVTLISIYFFLRIQKKDLNVFFHNLKKILSSKKPLLIHFTIRKGKIILPLLGILLFLQAVVNLSGALGPELAFDALWYHLTLPQLFLLHRMIYGIPGGLLYYSDMPKLGEMLYIGALSFGNEILAKLIQYVFGLLIVIAIYIFSRSYFNKTVSLLVVAIFYANLVVDWESITAYIDLIRTFFEFLALWALIMWSEKFTKKWFILSAVTLGAAITTKVLAIGSLIIVTPLIIASIFGSKYILTVKAINIKITNKFILSLVTVLWYWLIVLAIPFPWFIFSYSNTGSPFYPFFTHIYEIAPNPPIPFQLFHDLWNLFLYSSDPISPVYLIFLPLLFLTYSKFSKQIKLILWYCILSLFVWYFTPRTGGGRFMLVYLPAFSIICGAIYAEISTYTANHWKFTTNVLLAVIIFISVISIGYRALANAKFLPVIVGLESKNQFLTNQLNFKFGDFYDTDGYFMHTVKQSDRVLLYGFHNLYYVDFPYTDSSWVRKGDKFDYIALQKTSLPTRFKNWQLIYLNDRTMVQLYKPPKGECLTTCYY